VTPPVRQRILDIFEIARRGTVVVVAKATDLPTGTVLRATITCPDGSRFQADASKEWLLRSIDPPVEQECYLLRGVSKGSVPDGAEVECAIAS
jgi:hypothetical protein